ncbi:MAG: FkbM family methyltransferase, partial [Anaerolineales bacterium]
MRRRALLHELVWLTEYRHWLQQAGIQTLIDVGAYIGSFSWAMRVILPQVRIYAFEALEENYRSLVENLGGESAFHAFLIALADRRGNLEFYRDSFSASSSPLPLGEFHREIFPQTGYQKRIVLPQACLDDYLDQMELCPPVLLKLDVQGYELHVLRGAEQTLHKVDWILCEVSFYELYVGQPLFDTVYTWLKERG